MNNDEQLKRAGSSRTVDQISQRKFSNDQNFDSQRSLSKHASNHFSSFAALMSNTAGVTVLLMPKLFFQAGIISGSLQIICVGLLTYISASMLCEAGKATYSRTYFEIIHKAFGNFRYLPLFIYFVLLVGNIICYQTFVLKNLVPLVDYIFSLQYKPGTIQFTLFALLLTVLVNIVILPFLFSRKLKIVKNLSTFCSAAILVGVLIVLAVYFSPHTFGLPDRRIDWNLIEKFRFDGLYVSIGYYLLSFCFHLTVLDIADEVHPKTRHSTDLILFFNCAAAALIYLLVSFTGYFSIYTADNLQNMTNYINFLIVELGKNSILLYVGDLLVIISVVFANILNYVPFIKYLNSTFNAKPISLSKRRIDFKDGTDSLAEFDFHTDEDREAYKKRNRIIVWISFLIVFLLNLVITAKNVSLDVIFDFVGALCGPPVLLILPAILYLLVLKNQQIEKATWFDHCLAYTLLLVGGGIWGFCIFGFFKI